MDREILTKLIEEGKSQREISILTGKSQTTVRYWLNKHELVTKKIYLCRKCGQTDSRLFLQGRWTECRHCRSNDQSGRFRN